MVLETINKLTSKKTIRFCLILFAVFLIQFTANAFADNERIFGVGLALPLTGNAADYGQAIQNCIELAKKDRPEIFTHIRFHIEDTIYEPRLAVLAFNKLVDVNNVELAGTWGVSFCKALAPLAESRKIPFMGICIDPTTAANRHYVMRFMNGADELMQVMADYLHKQGKGKLGILLADHPYLEEMTEALKRNLKEGQTVTIADRLPNTEMDLRTQIIKLKKSDYDAIGVFLFAGQISTFYKQAKQMGFDKETFGTNFFESLGEIRSSGGAMKGSVFSSIEIKQSFMDRYKKTFGNDSQLAFGAPAYEFAIAVGELFNDKAATISKDEIIESFAKIKSRDGIAAGPYSYVNDSKVGQYFRFPIVMKRVTEDGIEVVK